MKGNGFNMEEGHYRLGIKEFFTMRAVKHWHRLPRELVAAPSMETNKAGLDGALGSLVSLRVFLLIGEGRTR